MITDDLRKQIEFCNELEKLKLIYRQNGLIDRSRPENSAEHSWHSALMAVILSEHALQKDLDILKVIKMLLIHDIVEIDAGDTFLYNEKLKENIKKEEEKAAIRIFGMLPERQYKEYYELWKEFEERKTPEAQYAASIDNLQPLTNHLLTRDTNENPNNMSAKAVTNKKKFIKNISPQLWEVAKDSIKKSIKKGLYVNDN